VDLVEEFVRFASTRDIRFFFLGAAPGVAERAAAILQRKYPGLIVAGTYPGSPDPAEEVDLCEHIRAVNPHVLLVAYRVPEQEFWMARNLQRLNVPIVINVGGTFDFIAGVTRRAPRWMRSVGFEWLFRLLYQPWRWRRMLALPRFIVAIMTERFWMTFGRIRPGKPVAHPAEE
jgi:N-acetylglucosaminyldiphosphoundecaprenol N-acetyl-beta-D-mannosaminyltransferase